jgi:hypothetical protein
VNVPRHEDPASRHRVNVMLVFVESDALVTPAENLALELTSKLPALPRTNASPLERRFSARV